MSDTTTPLTVENAPATRARVADYVELTKPRLSMLSVITAVVGYFASLPLWYPAEFFWMLLGTSLCAGGVAALNQWMESDTDALMHRTAQRPIPSGKIPTGSAFVLGAAACLLGLAILFAEVNGWSTFFALLTIASYLVWYTPAKRYSRWSTEIGAIAGAFPPLIGLAASEHYNLPLCVILFGILFFWQIPHFMAIGWIYRADYEAVKFPMLPVRDQKGNCVAIWSFVATVALVVVSAAPFYYHLTGAVYLWATGLFGAWFIYRAALFLRPAGREISAKKLFFASIGWLPLQLGALVACRYLHGW